MELYFGYVIFPKTKITQWKYNFIVFLNPKYNGIVLLLYIKKNQKKNARGRGRGKSGEKNGGRGKSGEKNVGNFCIPTIF